MKAGTRGSGLGTGLQHPAAASGSAESRVPSPGSRLRICYGGTFDPIHLGHLAIADAAQAAFGVPVHLLPAADPPHRAPPGADAARRACMVELAIAEHPGLRLDLRELERADDGRPSYTVDTLATLRAELGADVPLAWLMGADSLASLRSWHRWQDLLGLAHLIVADRDVDADTLVQDATLQAYLAPHLASSAMALTSRPNGLLWRLRQPLRGESASEVRQRLHEGDAARELLPPAVADYIQRHTLYR